MFVLKLVIYFNEKDKKMKKCEKDKKLHPKGT
jgi:hypothetical protein